MSTTKTMTVFRHKCIHGTRTLRPRRPHLGRALVTALLLLASMPIVAVCNPQHGLRLSAVIAHGELVAVLTNVTNRPIKTVGMHVSAIPGSGGYYVVLHNSKGDFVKYCGMIDSRNPVTQLLEPTEKIVYRDTVASLVNQYCLGPGKYTGKVMYYNSLPFGKTAYSEPIASGAFEFIVPSQKARVGRE